MSGARNGWRSGYDERRAQARGFEACERSANTGKRARLVRASRAAEPRRSETRRNQMSGDEKLRELIEKAHQADAPPSLERLLAREPRRSRAPLVLVAGLLASAAALFFLSRLRQQPAPPPLVELRLPARAPLDFLLDTPGADLWRETPRFDTKGLWP